ncbi:jg19257 [Pararge aegeria aegeria]|uniref:Jg19257 protein n=1 Tax=Pararge aegeria aegeria TaxID=348720 RepID=A0A8S4S7V5_9NEOP|nr:jg19257 [Pararge aegeria aegeria]
MVRENIVKKPACLGVFNNVLKSTNSVVDYGRNPSHAERRRVQCSERVIGNYLLMMRIHRGKYPPGVQEVITVFNLHLACMETNATPIHVELQCNGVSEYRGEHLGSSASLPEAFGDLGGLLSFWTKLCWLELFSVVGLFRPTNYGYRLRNIRRRRLHY